jgi:hypothetical protein
MRVASREHKDRQVVRIPTSLAYRAGVLVVGCFAFVLVGAQRGGAVAYVFGGVLGLLALRTLMIRVIISSAGILIVNMLRTYRIAWPDVEHLRYEERGFTWIGRGIGATRHRVILERKHGIEVSIAASQSVHRDILGRSLPGADRTQRCLQSIEKARRNFTPELNPS